MSWRFQRLRIQIFTVHRSGAVKIKSIEQSEQHIRIRGDIAVVSALSHIVGEIGSVRADAILRFTRVWQKSCMAVTVI